MHLNDLQNAPDEFALGRELAIKFGHRSILGVPLIREGQALGTILVRRIEVRPFEDKHIALLKTFADQAAIAIENVRLFDELDPAGKPIGFVALPERCANLCFGGVKRNRLFMAASHSLYSLYVNTQGVAGG